MSLETDVQILASVPMLSEFSDDKLRLLAFSSENRTYRDGQRLFAAGDRADAGFVIADGRVALHEPGRPDPVTVLGPGALVGELALIVDGQRAMTATAVGAATAIMIRRPVFRRMLDEYPDIAARMRARFADQLSATTRALLIVRDRLDRIGE
ncbi:MAG TPA: Crp/Fnr family transcriptional regulator [Methylomirabilota bacterium]|nr:Crp/Fnr family transcriptional regulator [Methylomirabilota bacterium]